MAFHPVVRPALVSPAENGPVLAWVLAVHASAAGRAFPTQHRRLIYWDAAHGGAGFLFDFGFAVAAAAPGGESEAAFYGLLEVVIRLGFAGVGTAERQSLVIERPVNLHAHFFYHVREVSPRTPLL